MFYNEYLKNKTNNIKTSAELKWEELFYHDNFEWKEIYTLPYLVCRETNIQSFQYQIINRYIACNEALSKWGKSDTPLCVKCNVVESIEHMFFHCIDSTIFWTEFNKIWYLSYNFKINLRTEDIIFGVIDNMNSPEIHALNFCILHARQFIYRRNIDGKKVEINYFLDVIRNKLYTERHIMTEKGEITKFIERYQPIEQFLKEQLKLNQLRTQ